MNNVQIVMAALAFVSLLMTILGGAWINQRGLAPQMDAFRQEMTAEIGAFRAETRAEFQSVRAGMDSLNQRLDRVERQLDAIFKPAFPKTGD